MGWESKCIFHVTFCGAAGNISESHVTKGFLKKDLGSAKRTSDMIQDDTGQL